MHPLQAEAGQKGEEKRRKKLKIKIIITILWRKMNKFLRYKNKKIE